MPPCSRASRASASRAAFAALDPRCARRLTRRRRRRGASPQTTTPPAGRNSGPKPQNDQVRNVRYGLILRPGLHLAKRTDQPMQQLRLTRDDRALTKALKAFPDRYHRGFVEARKEAVNYLAADCSNDSVRRFSRVIQTTLESWGAGKRRAPRLVTEDSLCAALACKARRRRFKRLAHFTIDRLSVVGCTRRVRNPHRLAPTEFDRLLLSTLRDISDVFFIANTNVTYPMKGLLLVTGQMPAFDSRVRKGLARAGLPGFAATQFLVPPENHSVAARRITDVGFILGTLWRNEAPRLRAALASAKRIELEAEVGRIFDMLLFMQGRPGTPILIDLR